MSFLGRKIRSYFEGEIVSNVCDLSFKRIPGARIKHRVKQNWLKMYGKSGSVLRLEMVINEPEGFTVRKQVTRKGKKVMRWVDMRKGVAYLFRYRDVSFAANSRYLTALAEVDDPPMPSALWIASRRPVSRSLQNGRPKLSIRSPVMKLRSSALCSTANIRNKLKDSPHLKDIADWRRQSAKVTRIFNRCHAHGLIAKIPHSRRWRLTKQGRIAMTASIQLRDVQFPITHMKLTA